jgi:hypothetical protein
LEQLNREARAFCDRDNARPDASCTPVPASSSRPSIEERYRRRSTIITTNLEYEEWHNFLGNKALVDALAMPLPQKLLSRSDAIRRDGRFRQ